jgi:multiple antibiotic resistance protein
MKTNRVLMGGLVAVMAVLAVEAIAQTAIAAPATAQATLAAIPLGKIFTYFMVMLGPNKLIAPFVSISRGMDDAACRSLAFKGFAIACLAGVAAATMGQKTLAKWGVSLPALLVAAGLVLLLVALQSVLAQYEPRPAKKADAPAEPATPSLLTALSPLAFPSIITPFGSAALILLLAAAPAGQDLEILGVFLAVMVINLIAMLLARPIIKYGAALLQIVGAVLGVLQVALAVEMFLIAASMLGILPKPLG